MVGARGIEPLTPTMSGTSPPGIIGLFVEAAPLLSALRSLGVHDRRFNWTEEHYQALPLGPCHVGVQGAPPRIADANGEVRRRGYPLEYRAADRRDNGNPRAASLHSGALAGVPGAG
jgi:hypothetical protein